MKKCLIILALNPFFLFAQSNEEGIIKEDSTSIVEVKITIDKLASLENSKSDYEKKLKNATIRILELEKKIKEDSVSIRNQSVRISRLREDSLSIHNIEKSLREQLLKSDKCLISVASNFLYIPYEAYSVDSIAIRSFESISDKSLKQKYNLRYALLKTYRDDIVNFIAFLELQQKDLNKPFTKDAKDAIVAFHGQSFYIAYHDYEDWPSTYLGKKISDVEKQLKSFNGSSKIDFRKIIDNLQECLKTE